jgi:CheY-like chemotaxis protein
MKKYGRGTTANPICLFEPARARVQLVCPNLAHSAVRRLEFSTIVRAVPPKPLPLPIAHSQPEGPLAVPRACPGVVMSKTVLIVEDDEIARTGLCTILLSHGYDALTAVNGEEALKRLRVGPPPDLILLDMVLPTFDGWRFLPVWRQDPALSSIPLMVMTGLSIASDEWAKALGAVCLLRKPIDVSALLATIDHHTTGSAA